MTNLTEKWLNIYQSKKNGSYWSGAFCYKTKEEAVKDLADTEHYLATVNVEDMLNLQTQNTKLKDLLKECKEEINNDMVYTEYNEVGKDTLLTKINKILGEE